MVDVSLARIITKEIALHPKLSPIAIAKHMTHIVMLASYKQSPRYRVLKASANLESSLVKRLLWYYGVPIQAMGGLTAHQAVSKGLNDNLLELLTTWVTSERIDCCD